MLDGTDLPLPPAVMTSGLQGPGVPVRGRPLRHGDLEEARHVLPKWLDLNPQVRARLVLIWTQLLGRHGFDGHVIEDLSRPPGRRIVGLGVTVALDSAWQQRMREAPPPHAGAVWYHDFMEGSTAPMDDRALGLANLRGEVGMLVLHYAQEAIDPQRALVQQVLLAAMQLYRQAHGGYHLCDVWQEALADGGDYLLGMGFRRRTGRGRGQPDLHGLSRVEAAQSFPGTPVRDIFHFVPPVLGFSGAERRMLRLAVAELTDEQIAEDIGISAHTLKKLWRSAFERTAEQLPHLFMPEGSGEAGTRGPEKRRHLLNYLRQHLEELRPYG